MKQNQFEPMSIVDQVVILYAVVNGLLDAIEVEKIKNWEIDFLKFMHSSHRKLMEQIKETKSFDQKIESDIKEAIGKFNTGFKP